MKKSKSLYRGHRFPAVIISCAVRLYFCYQLSLRDIEELLFERGVIVTYAPKEVPWGTRRSDAGAINLAQALLIG